LFLNYYTNWVLFSLFSPYLRTILSWMLELDELILIKAEAYIGALP
jgi:hypothetical protein